MDSYFLHGIAIFLIKQIDLIFAHSKNSVSAPIVKYYIALRPLGKSFFGIYLYGENIG